MSATEVAEIDAANPRTGEILDRLDTQPPEKLAEALEAVTSYQQQMRRWQGALETELRRRLRLVNRKSYTFGGWEVSSARKKESEWDAGQLADVIDALVKDGTIKAKEAVGVIVQDAPYVQRTEAKRFANSLEGEARDDVLACCEWKEKPGKLTVAKAVDLVEQAVDSTAVEVDGTVVAITERHDVQQAAPEADTYNPEGLFE